MRRLALAVALAALCACGKKTENPPPPDAGTPADNACASSTDAATSTTCTIILGQQITGFIYPSGNHDWYHVKVDQIPPRALLQVTAGYKAPESPVTLQVLLFQGDAAGTATALRNLGTASDQKPLGAPSPVNVVARISQPGDYYVLLQDDTSDNDDPQHGDADAKHAYTLTASVSSDPDQNEPNDTPATATVISLSGGSGSSTGVLATNGDVDVYAVDVPTNLAPPHRSVLYVGIDAPEVDPPSQVRLSYRIDLEGTDGGAPVAGGQVPTPVGEQKVSTARLVPAAGRYLVTVTGYKQHPEDPDAPGDPRLQYTVTVKLMDDLDTNEPNDTVQTATPVSLGSVGASQTLEGRIGYIPDFDWYAVSVPGSSQNTRIHYKVTWNDGAANSKRFPAAGGNIDDHQLTFVKVEPDTSTCLNSCPAVDPSLTDGCTRATPQCIFSYRLQDTDTPTGLDNFEGMIPVPAGSGGTFHILVDDLSNDAADDRAYSLQVEWLAETSDESGGYHDDGASAVAITPPMNGSYAADPGSAGAAQGSISYGHLQLANDQAANAPVIPINGSNPGSTVPTIDYDALNDSDFFRLSLPNTTTTWPDGGTGYAAASWSSAWTVPAAAGQGSGQRPYDLTMTYYFCDPSENPGCDPNGRWEAIAIAYGSGNKASWTGSDQPGWDFDAASGRFVTRANECFCVEPRFLQGGVAYLQVGGVSRTSYSDASYTVNTAFGPYPQSYTASDGTTKACPTDGAGDCHFCAQLYGACQSVYGLQVH